MATKLTDRASIPAILKEMTIAEKLTLLTGSTTFRAGGNEEHGIPFPLFLDGGTGFNTMQMGLEATFQAYEEICGKVDPESCTGPMGGFGVAMGAMALVDDETKEKIQKRIGEIMDETRPADGVVGCYPPGMFFGATWNPDVIYDCGEALGREAVACHIDCLLGTPNVNIHRDPRNGRLFEGYSEDPYLVGALAPSFVKGIQSTGIVADVKHYAANNLETDRMGTNETISERAMREIYLPGFEACIKDGGCKSVMSAYNSINGVPCAHSTWLLRDVLRRDWGFKGFVKSDWGAVYDRVAGQNGGNDVCMPGPREIGSMLKAVEEGTLTEETIDEACTNYLNILLDMPCMMGRKYDSIDIEYSKKAAYAAAKEGITLLKNKDGILPLAKTAGVAYYGPRSKKFVESGAGSAEVATPVSTNMFDCTVEKIGADKVAFEEITENTDYVIVTVGANGQEGADRMNMQIEEVDKPVISKAIADAKAAGKPVILVLNVSAPVELVDWIDDVEAILCVYLPGMMGGQAAADILFGDVNPSGKLPLTFPKVYKDAPSYGNFPGEYMRVNYGEGIYVGYRWYDKKEVEPQFPFGFGLSYTRFELSNLKVSEQANLDNGGTVKVSVDVKNIGRVAGAEVVQIYVSDPESTLDRPVKELKGIKKVFLEPGEKKTVEIELGFRAFAAWDTYRQKWVAEPGEFDILVGTSSKDIRLCAATQVKCYNEYGLSETVQIAKLVADPVGMSILKKNLPGVEIMPVVSEVVVFAPRTPFHAIWDRNIATAPALNHLSDEEKASVYKQILADFEEANRSGVTLKGEMNIMDAIR